MKFLELFRLKRSLRKQQTEKLIAYYVAAHTANLELQSVVDKLGKALIEIALIKGQPPVQVARTIAVTTLKSLQKKK